jgi:hypothetical protein
MNLDRVCSIIAAGVNDRLRIEGEGANCFSSPSGLTITIPAIKTVAFGTAPAFCNVPFCFTLVKNHPGMEQLTKKAIGKVVDRVCDSYFGSFPDFRDHILRLGKATEYIYPIIEHKKPYLIRGKWLEVWRDIKAQRETGDLDFAQMGNFIKSYCPRVLGLLTDSFFPDQETLSTYVALAIYDDYVE